MKKSYKHFAMNSSGWSIEFARCLFINIYIFLSIKYFKSHVKGDFINTYAIFELLFNSIYSDNFLFRIRIIVVRAVQRNVCTQ